MEENLIARLLATSAVVTLVNNRIYPGARPQGSLLPAIVMHRISGGPEYADDGEVGLLNSRVQVDCWGLTYTSAKLVARAVTASLTFFVGTVGTTVFELIELETERDLREAGSNAAEYPFRTALDFMVWSRR